MFHLVICDKETLGETIQASGSKTATLGIAADCSLIRLPGPPPTYFDYARYFEESEPGSLFEYIQSGAEVFDSLQRLRRRRDDAICEGN